MALWRGPNKNNKFMDLAIHGGGGIWSLVLFWEEEEDESFLINSGLLHNLREIQPRDVARALFFRN